MKKLLLSIVSTSLLLGATAFADTCPTDNYCVFVQLNNLNQNSNAIKIRERADVFINDKWQHQNQDITIIRNTGTNNLVFASGLNPAQNPFKDVRFITLLVNNQKPNTPCEVNVPLINTAGQHTITIDGSNGVVSCQIS